MRKVILLLLTTLFSIVSHSQMSMWIEKAEVSLIDTTTNKFGPYSTIETRSDLRFIMTTNTLVLDGTNFVYTLQEVTENTEENGVMIVSRWAKDEDGKRCIVMYRFNQRQNSQHLVITYDKMIIRYTISKLTKI